VQYSIENQEKRVTWIKKKRKRKELRNKKKDDRKKKYAIREVRFGEMIERDEIRKNPNLTGFVDRTKDEDNKDGEDGL
jgi:hypothetical protein